MYFLKWLTLALLRIVFLFINLVLIVGILFIAALYVTNPDAATEIGRSCISCKRPAVDTTGLCGIDKGGRAILERWRDALTAKTRLPKVEPEANPKQLQREALVRVNRYRKIAGENPLTLNSDINKAATAHVEYNLIHNTPGHTETCGDKGFTGAWPWDRLRHFGYKRFTYVTEVCSMQWASQSDLLRVDPKWAVDGWFETVYHRLPLLNPNVYETGFAALKKKDRVGYVMDIANPGFESKKRIICYPVDTQANVPVEFSGDEVPDPLPGKIYPVGYPVTVLFSNYSEISIKNARLVDGSGRTVSVYLLSPFSDDHIGGNLAIIPVFPLRYSKQYHVVVHALADGSPVSLAWRFTTESFFRQAGRISLFDRLASSDDLSHN